MKAWRGVIMRLWLAAIVCVMPVPAAADDETACRAPDAQNPVTIEIVLAKKWKGQLNEIVTGLQANDPSIKVRTKIFPFIDPPANIGIGKCVPAGAARTAIAAALQYYGKLDRLIRQDILPLYWVKLGSTDTAELAWVAVTPEELARLRDPALSTEQFQQRYRQLATPGAKPLPFGMGQHSGLAPETAPPVEVISHEWRPDEVWERIGKTKFLWKATVRNNLDVKKRVYVYYDLLDAGGYPLARNVSNQLVEPHQIVDIRADSYIMSADLPNVRSSRAVAKIGP